MLFDFAERRSREHHIQKLHTREETFAWVWEESSYCTSPFPKWLRDGTGLFWISGKPGSGKSTLMEYLVNHNHTRDTLQSNNSLDWSIIYFFFDFRAGDHVQNSFEGLLRSLLFQIFSKVSQLPEDIIKELENIDSSELSERLLQRLFRTTLERSSQCICIFIDGLDEYSGKIVELTRFFQAVGNIRNSLGGTIKICVASRPEPEIVALFEGIPYFALQDHNHEGIKSYISMILGGIPSATRKNGRLEDLAQSISKNAEGVFLWARFAIEEVYEGYARGKSISELIVILEKLPKDLEDIYERIFERMSPDERDEGMVMLQIICFSGESDRKVESSELTLEDLSVAVDLAMNKTKVVKRNLDDAECEQFRKRLRSRSGGLLEVVDKYDPDPWLRTRPFIDADWNPSSESISGSSIVKSTDSTLEPISPLTSVVDSTSENDSTSEDDPTLEDDTSENSESDSDMIRRPFAVLRSEAFQEWRMAGVLKRYRKAWNALTQQGQRSHMMKVSIIKLIHKSVKTFLRQDAFTHPLDALQYPLTNHQALIRDISIRYIQNILPYLTFEHPSTETSFDTFFEDVECSLYIDGTPYGIIQTDMFPFFFFAIDTVFYYAKQQEIEKDAVSDIFSQSQMAEKIIFLHHSVQSRRCILLFEEFASVSTDGCELCSDSKARLNCSYERAALLSYFLHGLFYSAQNEIQKATNIEINEKISVLQAALGWNVFHKEKGCKVNTKRPQDTNNRDHCHKLIVLALDLQPVIQVRHLEIVWKEGLVDAMRLLIGCPSFKDLQLADEHDSTVGLLWILVTTSIYGLTLEEEHHEIARILLEVGGNINEICGPDGTPLQTLVADSHISRQLGRDNYKSIAQILLDNGSNVNVDNGYGKALAILQRQRQLGIEISYSRELYEHYDWLEGELKQRGATL